jgi:uncharacterized protein (DUF1684 family)
MSTAPDCTRSAPAPVAKAGPVDPQLLAGRQQFRIQQDGRLRSELSPLARVDYTHLPVGEHTVGPSEAATVRLAAAADVGEVRLRVSLETGLHRLALHAAPAIPRNGVPVADAALRNGDVLAVGRLRLLVAGLPEDPAVATYDGNARARLDYSVLLYFPDDERFVTRAKLERYPSPRAVRLDASRGEPKVMQALGLLRFTLNGTPAAMEAYSEGPETDQLFLLFKDQTNGKPEGSYGAGRFLSPRLLAGDEVLLDFNQAWNPLCAYSPYFHCPLPPRSNWLALPIPAGERAYPGH